MKLIQGSFAKRVLMVGLIAGSGILTTSAFAVSTGSTDGKAGCEAGHGEQSHTKWEARRVNVFDAEAMPSHHMKGHHSHPKS